MGFVGYKSTVYIEGEGTLQLWDLGAPTHAIYHQCESRTKPPVKALTSSQFERKTVLQQG